MYHLVWILMCLEQHVTYSEKSLTGTHTSANA